MKCQIYFSISILTEAFKAYKSINQNMEWMWKKFSDLTVFELYQIIQLRERVFVAEQNCIYIDCDGSDLEAWHLMGYKNSNMVAYLRAFPPNIKYKEASFGRVLTLPEARSEGYGKALVKMGIENMERSFEGVATSMSIRISAQAYLKKFYENFRFKKVSEEYFEDNIPHIEMLRE